MNTLTVEEAATVDTAPATEPQERVASLAQWHNWYWLLVALLAVAAYVTVLRIGLLSDDLVLLSQAQQSGIDLSIFVPQPHFFLYRPAGYVLIWQVGRQLWGYNALPFHIQGLLLHAAVSLVIGLLVAEVTKRRSLGWLAGALFAVFPLHLEAVGWVAAQWDTLATFFGVTSLWLCVFWWHRGRNSWLTYTVSLLLYALAIFSKESMLTFFPLFALSLWVADQPRARDSWRTLGLALLPYLGVLAFNAGLRLAYWGHLGGYGRDKFDFSALLPIFWDQITNYGKLLLAPINSTVWGQPATQVVGLISTLLIVTGLVWFGRRHWRSLLLAGLWIITALLPVLLLPVGASDLQNNRFLYLAAGGYCVAVATLMYALITSTYRWRKHLSVLVGTLLFSSVVVCWVQLSPWYTATVQASSIDNDLARLIPPAPNANNAIWYVENTPDNYKGAYVYRLGLGATRYFTSGERLNVANVADVTQVHLDEGAEDRFAMRFMYSEPTSRFFVNYGAGITTANQEVTPQSNASQLFWDFRGCQPEILSNWTPENARLQCRKGDGLLVNPTNDDPQIILNTKPLLPSETEARYVRLRVFLRSETQTAGKDSMQWFWGSPAQDFTEANSRRTPLRLDGKPYIYWAIIPTSQLGNALTGLRLDPVNSMVPTVIQYVWIDVI